MTADVDWEISNLYPGINCLALCFVSCRFAWFKREANSTAHELANLLLLSMLRLFVMVYLFHPRYLRHGKEICSLFPSFNESLLIKKKKMVYDCSRNEDKLYI
jgi:hypothetical protein